VTMQTGCIDENYFEPYDIRVNMSFAEWLKLAESGPSASRGPNLRPDETLTGPKATVFDLRVVMHNANMFRRPVDKN